MANIVKITIKGIQATLSSWLKLTSFFLKGKGRKAVEKFWAEVQAEVCFLSGFVTPRMVCTQSQLLEVSTNSLAIV
jgi:hypothetical protein